MATNVDRDPSSGDQPSAWSRRHQKVEARAFAAAQRALGSKARDEAVGVRAAAEALRVEAAQVRDEGARTRDEAAQVRDQAARVRDQAARTREEVTRLRLERATAREAWPRVPEPDQDAAEQSREVSSRDRDAATLDRAAAEKDRDAAERDRAAAAKDREAAEKERLAVDADRTAAESDALESDRDLELVEDRLSKTDRLEVMGRMAAGIAHEINNPLGALMLTLTALQAERGSDPAVGALVLEARLAAERIALVVAELKAWLHGEASPAPHERVELPRVVREAVRLAGRATDAARLVVDVPGACQVIGAPGRLAQVVTNLVLNAAQSIAGPREDNQILVTLNQVAGHARLEVSDTGSGIAPDVLPHVFDPFFTTHEGRGGSGLGLALGLRIAQEHGGTLTVVETRQAKGSTFRLELPLATALPPAFAPSLSAPVPGSPRPAVLIIDDDAAFTRSLVRLLNRRCEVVVAHDGAEGLSALLAEGAHFALVLCDLMMPVMNGLELYRRLNEVRPELARALVFVSGGATTSQTANFLASVPNTQLQKPFDTRRLFALLEERAGPVAEA